KSKLSFWKGDATNVQAYRGPWHVIVTQHVIQHVPKMLVPLKEALGDGGRAVICTWPASSEDCPAYNFLYQAACEGTKQIGMSLGALHDKVNTAGLRVTEAMTVKVLTPSVEPNAFLRQYLEGKQNPPENVDGYLTQPRVMEVAQANAQIQNGLAQFWITMNM